jgi:hypothetical protein
MRGTAQHLAVVSLGALHVWMSPHIITHYFLLLPAEAFAVATAQDKSFAVSQALALASTDAAICGAQAELQSLLGSAGRKSRLLM